MAEGPDWGPREFQHMAEGPGWALGTRRALAGQAPQELSGSRAPVGYGRGPAELTQASPGGTALEGSHFGNLQGLAEGLGPEKASTLKAPAALTALSVLNGVAHLSSARFGPDIAGSGNGGTWWLVHQLLLPPPTATAGLEPAKCVQLLRAGQLCGREKSGTVQEVALHGLEWVRQCGDCPHGLWEPVAP
ncbi:hypothetical protein WISP_12629 [Willisornis vidua]|uniref:Uncharacterized protein n=1 Tax=Willisornis vidua TaxID=1566151 RepID=A0ABQ9DWP5_9PASS|nr:hypothetical protein WISP_12629 [Willisornis vidua]